MNSMRKTVGTSAKLFKYSWYSKVVFCIIDYLLKLFFRLSPAATRGGIWFGNCLIFVTVTVSYWAVGDRRVGKMANNKSAIFQK